MKKLISTLLVFIFIFTLCSCGTVTIGPLDFHFDKSDRGSFSDSSSEITYENATAADAPAMEFAPAEESEYTFEDFSVNPIGIYMGDFTSRGYSAMSSSDNPALYLFFAFEYTEYYGDYIEDEHLYVTHVVIDGISYPALDLNSHENHFIRNIDRYFCYNYASPHRALSAGESSQMIVCFEIPEEARKAIYAGADIEFCVHGTNIQYNNFLDITFLEEILNEAPVEGGREAALSSAQLLWSLDMSYYLINYLRLSTEVYGDTGVFDTYPAEIIFGYYSRGTAFSPAVMPDLDGEFLLEMYGMQGMVPEIALEMYGGDVMDTFFEYRDICLTIADMSMGTGNADALLEMCDYAAELYQMLMALLGMTPYEYEIYEV